MPEILLRDIVKRFGDHVAIDHIDLRVRNGEYMVLLGPTGAGKTTLLRTISGLVQPEEGHVVIGDRDVTSMPPEERGLAFMSQTYSLFPNMMVWDNVEFGPAVRGVSQRDVDALAREMLLLVGLLDRRDAFPRELSGGMQQRTALARALAAGTDVLLLDEPLRALDARLRIALRLSIRRLCKDLGITAIHVTHDQEEALLVADRVAILRHGRIEQIGSSREVYDNPASPFVAQFMGEANFLIGKIQEANGTRTVLRSNGRVWQARPSHLSPHQEACMAVKSEKMKIIRGGSGLPNTFDAKVTRRFFLGRFVGLEMKSDVSEKTMKAKVTAVSGEKITEGDNVSVSMDPRHCMIFPLPPTGLEKELEVE